MQRWALCGVTGRAGGCLPKDRRASSARSGVDCDVDICAECVTGQPASPPRGEACCDGACGARLRAGTWRYACGDGCDYEICASCEVDEAREGVTVIATGVKQG